MKVLSQNLLSLLIVCAVVYDSYVSGYYTLSCCTRKCDGGNEVCNLIPGSGSSSNKGRWECVVGCDYSISSPTNGDVVVSGYLVGLSSSFRYAVGANATYACDHGYTLVGGTNPRQCLANGTWSGSRPECDPVTCGALSAPANGTVSFSNDDLVESIATFSCDEGYVITGPQQLVCLGTGAWSESAPTCSSVDCPTLELPCNGLFVDVPANAKPGDFATYACLEGFEVDGNSTRICQDDYTWGGISPCCVRTCRQMAEYLLPYNGSSYRQVDTPLSWVEAQENCKAEGAALLELVDVTETVLILGAFDNTMASSLRPRSKIDYKALNVGKPLSLKKVICKTPAVLEETYYVERFISRRRSQTCDRYEYLVKWQDFHITDATWEVESNLPIELRSNFIPAQIDDGRLRQFSANFEFAMRARLKSKTPEFMFCGDLDVYRYIFGAHNSVLCNLGDFDKLSLPAHWYYDLCKDGTGRKLKFPVKVSPNLSFRKIYVKCNDSLVLKKVPVERVKVFACTESCSIDDL